MQRAREAEVVISYNGQEITASIKDSLLDLSYSDNPAGQIDDLQISLEDRHQKWQGPWSPAEGDSVSASIRLINWDYSLKTISFPLGTFEVDSVALSGPPDVVKIKALSLPGGTSVKQERRSQGWEKISLRAIAQDIAKRAKLKLLYDAPDNPIYERIDQMEQSDMAFLLDTCTKEGIALKVSSGKLVLFDEATYEKQNVVATITRGIDAIINYSFSWSTTDSAYRACQITYADSKKHKEIKVVYTPPGAPKQGPMLKINESVNSEGEALRLASKRLREQNKNFGRASLQLAGDVRLSTGLTINLVGWGRYDGKYIIERAEHSVGGGGYSTSVDIRMVLGW
ncbi:phage late control D family protein [Paenibacillus sp. NRS-1760]|uniref:phage late control D family protein n=1 Tax=Paenibacillus sp. NRS-1760 TaxID=3233902 RepID=UPI003D2DE410